MRTRDGHYLEYHEPLGIHVVIDTPSRYSWILIDPRDGRIIMSMGYVTDVDKFTKEYNEGFRVQNKDSRALS